MLSRLRRDQHLPNSGRFRSRSIAGRNDVELELNPILPHGEKTQLVNGSHLF